MVIYEKIKNCFSRNWSLIWWFLISFSGEFVADMAFGKKVKSLKPALEFLLLAVFHYYLALYTPTHLFLYGLPY